MKIKTTFGWANHYDWIIIPSIMIGFRPYGIGFAILFLKIKAELIFKWKNYETGL